MEQAETKVRHSRGKDMRRVENEPIGGFQRKTEQASQQAHAPAAQKDQVLRGGGHMNTVEWTDPSLGQ